MERVRQRDPLGAAALARLAFALLLSLAVHAVLLVRVEQGPRQPDANPVIRARLAPAAATQPSTPVSTPVSAPVATSVAAATPAAGVAEGAGTPPARATETAAPERASPADTVDAALVEAPPARLQPPVDLNYYSAAELDLYPAPLQPIEPQLERVPGGWIRILTSISETGQVDDAAVFDAQPQDVFDLPALQAVRQARFRPARRDGRDVRSRVLIELRVGDAPVADGR